MRVDESHSVWMKAMDIIQLEWISFSRNGYHSVEMDIMSCMESRNVVRSFAEVCEVLPKDLVTKFRRKVSSRNYVAKLCGEVLPRNFVVVLCREISPQYFVAKFSRGILLQDFVAKLCR